jgi:hypothetical protein
MKNYIYILIDPETYQVKYIGKSNDTKRRFRDHLKEARRGTKTYVYNWIRSLLVKDLIPIIDIIEECNEINWKERECYWIAFYTKCGVKLCNLTIGGDGNNMLPEVRTRLSNSLKGIPKSEETKRRMKANHVGTTGYKFSEESKNKQKIALKKRDNPNFLKFANRGDKVRGKNGNAKKVQHLKTGKIFECLKDGCEYFKLNYGSQVQTIRKKCKTMAFNYI